MWHHMIIYRYERPSIGYVLDAFYDQVPGDEDYACGMLAHRGFRVSTLNGFFPLEEEAF